MISDENDYSNNSNKYFNSLLSEFYAIVGRNVERGLFKTKVNKNCV